VIPDTGNKTMDRIIRDVMHRGVVTCPVDATAEKIATRYQIERPQRSRKPVETEFILNLGVACDLWQRPDLGHEPEHAKQVAEVLQKVGIRVHKVSGGWLECEPRPVGIREALTGRLAEPNWAKQFNCPPERSGQLLKLLSDKGIPVSDF